MADGPETSLVAQVAEVEVDKETGEVTVKRLTTAHNTGAILNPLTHQGQIDGGVVMGLGYGTMEELAMDDGGRVVTANLGDYKIPNIKDIPELKTTILQSATGSGPYRSMSIGETAIIPTAAAIANAVADAVGVRITSLPISAEKVLNALRRDNESGSDES
jgi:CO/xanthine dehydrogenase Mo-binding subunit